MKRSPWLSVVCCAALLSLNSGCLITRYNTNVVRKNEKPRAVQFESAQAKNIFEGKEVEVKTNLTSVSNPRFVAVPFLLLWGSTDVVSDNGIYNDQLAICDTNGDGVISFDEATTYAARVDEKIAMRNAEKAKQSPQSENHESTARNTELPARENPPPQPTYPAQPVSASQPIGSPQAPLPPGSYR
jgi:hypothetical protein